MTVPSRSEQVVALAALLVPDRAGRLLPLLAAPHGTLATARIATLAGLSRRERVAALSSALAPPAPVAVGHTATQILLARFRRDVAVRPRRASGSQGDMALVRPAPGSRTAVRWHEG